ncbi:MAG TPA: uroporphyrinogen-III synthase [Steroidobacteraceae bacterium]|nr:uroporphyrinogen-III synthase [Steroidobacteraceae bacterium]
MKSATDTHEVRTAGQSKAVVVTRAEASDGPLSSQLREFGLNVLLWPAVSVRPTDPHVLEDAVRNLQQFNWIVFASRHAVAAVLGLHPKAPEGVRIAAVGQATAQVLKQRGWRVDLVPDEASAASLVAAFSACALRGVKIFFPASSRALPTLSAGLAQLGAEVLQVEAYRTESASLDVEECRAWIARDAIGAVTFASPSAVIELEMALGKEHFERLLAHAQGVAIGPTTARELADRGRPAVLAESATLRGLALTTYRLMEKRH